MTLMFDWLDTINRRCDEINPERTCFKLAPSGATTTAQQLIEERLGVPLSPSHRAFLQRWNGMNLLEDHRIYSTSEILAGLDAAPFAPFTGNRDICARDIDPSAHAYFAAKPAYQFICRSFETIGIYYALDTHAPRHGEYAVCEYDPEYGLEHHLQPQFPSFEAMLMEDVLMFLLDETADMIADSPHDFSDDQENELIEEFETMAIALKTQMMERGAKISPSYQVDWSDWR